MTRTRIEKRDSPTNMTLGVYDTEQAALGSALGNKLVGVDQDRVAQFEEYEGPVLFARIGTRGPDVIYHLFMKVFPAESEMRQVMAEVFMEVVGSIKWITASFEDTHEFEEFPALWAVKVEGAAMNPLAVDKYLEEFIPALEKRLAH